MFRIVNHPMNIWYNQDIVKLYEEFISMPTFW